MKYDIYFHGGCFDGAASAAMLLWFLRQKGDSYGKFIPLTHPVNKKWWKNSKMKTPSAVVDIFYHPKAKIWFDHHPTTFVDKKWEKNFRRDQWHNLDIKSPSCAGLIYKHLSQILQIKPPQYIKELARWADILDGRLFKLPKPKDVFDFRVPALRIYYAAGQIKSRAHQEKIIELLSRRSLDNAAKNNMVRAKFALHEARFKKSIPLFDKSLSIDGKVITVDDSRGRLHGMKFMEYKYYPKMPYSIRILKRDGVFVLSVGENPWLMSGRVRIGKFLRRNFGGGGHQYVGGAEFRNKNGAFVAVKKIVKYLNQHG